MKCSLKGCTVTNLKELFFSKIYFLNTRRSGCTFSILLCPLKVPLFWFINQRFGLDLVCICTQFNLPIIFQSFFNFSFRPKHNHINLKTMNLIILKATQTMSKKKAKTSNRRYWNQYSLCIGDFPSYNLGCLIICSIHHIALQGEATKIQSNT